MPDLCEGEPCSDCGGTTLEFRGVGKDTEYRLCPRWQEPGHMSKDEMRAKIRSLVADLNPSGRFA